MNHCCVINSTNMGFSFTLSLIRSAVLDSVYVYKIQSPIDKMILDDFRGFLCLGIQEFCGLMVYSLVSRYSLRGRYYYIHILNIN